MRFALLSDKSPMLPPGCTHSLRRAAYEGLGDLWISWGTPGAAGSIGVWKEAARRKVDTAVGTNGIIGCLRHGSCIKEGSKEGKKDDKSLIDKAKQKSEGQEHGSTFQITARKQGLSWEEREFALHVEPLRV